MTPGGRHYTVERAIQISDVVKAYPLGADAVSYTARAGPRLAAPWWTYVVIVAVGPALPPLMTLIPLIKASRTTVREAIDHHGLGSRPSAASGILTRLGRIRRLNRGLLMALRNT